MTQDNGMDVPELARFDHPDRPTTWEEQAEEVVRLLNENAKLKGEVARLRQQLEDAAHAQ